MDFIKVIRSLEELLYEVMTWLVFYPRTMWRIAAHPAATTRYSEDEETQAGAEQYTDTLSPPLLLMLTILIAQVHPGGQRKCASSWAIGDWPRSWMPKRACSPLRSMLNRAMTGHRSSVSAPKAG